MIKEDYVSFEIYKLLKEKGFDGEIHTTFDKEGYTQPAITHQMAMKWLREKHNLCIEIFVTWRDKIPHYQWRINNLITQDTIVDTPCLEKLEEAVEAALKYTLKNLI